MEEAEDQEGFIYTSKVEAPERRKKKQVPHPSALCADGLRMTAKGEGRVSSAGSIWGMC